MPGSRTPSALTEPVRGPAPPITIPFSDADSSGIMADERRSHPRSAFRIPCSWAGQSGSPDSYLTDLSVDGCYIDCRTVPALGQALEVTATPDDGTPLPLAGVVVSATRNLGFGLQFRDLPEATRTRIAAMLGEAGQ